MSLNFSKEQYQLFYEIQNFFFNEMTVNLSDQEIEKLLLFIQETVSPYLYNSILYDVYRIIEKQCENIEEEVLNLEKSKKNVKSLYN
ncbi:DUF2164 family protein [Ureibacillus sp. 179-F W5.1 NHS]|uniref:DUF2164 family protein n=1 Tax=Lysinibacillus halotolerans TaxID=1368476 RepID=A0A3M8H6J9_9BACI|nr:DUF2164 family protein [Lysinibacillus halotolerans]RNC98017.1 DUF2164 family protein [Lysinibacillus halotolerans]